jgi:hypothetical protein
MAQIRNELRPSPTRPLPFCPECLRLMRLVSAQPDRHFTCIEVHEYACECGATNRVALGLTA